ncbi:MAG: type III-B CRISPR module RAMP protein Cmr1 [Caldisericia bacterium]|nr:type III-B CRISPR module RAMP protein Cmr1 [Caldisericia bacterium]
MSQTNNFFSSKFDDTSKTIDNMRQFTVKIKALTYIWTGDANREKTTLRETGIIGSLRWWYEALIRGFGGYACDPTSEEEPKRCNLDQKKFKKVISTGKTIQEALDNQICPACQLFGCTGWSRRFRLEVSGIDEKDINKGKGPACGLKPNTTFNLKLFFLFDLSPEQKWLFKKTLWLIENYGVIGGRTTWKPDGKWGTSYGLIKIEDYGDLNQWENSLSDIHNIRSLLNKNREKINKNKPDWFNFNFYWIIEETYLNRKQLNEIVKRNSSNPKKYLPEANDFDKWLGGKVPSEESASKKIFSFESPKKVFGYVRNEEELSTIFDSIKKVLNKSDVRLKTGKEILEELK